MKIHHKLIKSKQVAENTDLCSNFINYNFDQNGPPYFVLWLVYLIDSSKVIKVGGKQNPYEMWQAGISLAASPLAKSLADFARSRIPPATQASFFPPRQVVFKY